MAKIIIDSHYDIGGHREVYEDRVRARPVTTAAGLKLMVAAVADGVGGENKGERASQTTIDALFNYLEKSRETALPALLTQAVQYANKATFQLQRETSGASTTLAVAVVDEATAKLYIANVGDSRIYLCRNRKLTQLTIDHSWATVMAWQGKISAEAARDHPRANVLMRAIGPREQVEVDLGFYVGTSDYAEANERGQGGLPLLDGDAILVCSDGLIKDSPQTGEPLISKEEIIRTVTEKEGKKAAQELVSFALGRGPDDNISAALIQMPDRWRTWRARRPMLIAGGVIFALAIVLCVAVAALLITQRTLQTLSQEQQAATAQAATVAAYTATPSDTPTPSNTPTVTFTPSPTLKPFVAGQAGVIVSQNGDAFFLKSPLQAKEQEDMVLLIFHREGYSSNPGYLHALPGSLLQMNTIDDQAYQFFVSQASHVFVENGSYALGELQLARSNLTLRVEGSCLALDYPANERAIVSCYAGTCTYDALGGGSGSIAPGTQLLFSGPDLDAGEAQAIPEAEARQWASRLPVGSLAYDCANQYIPTPTPTRPAAKPPTQKEPDEPGHNPDPTNTPIPASNTAKPPNTNTPRPANTNTPAKAPTNTTAATKTTAPTQTPKPATATTTPKASTPTATAKNTATRTAVPSPTQTPQPTATPTSQPSNTPETPTEVPPTEVPPTDVPPTDVPPTATTEAPPPIETDDVPKPSDTPTTDEPPKDG